MEHGQINGAALDACLKTKTRNRMDEHLNEIENHLKEDMTPFALQVEQFSSVYGISMTASCAIIAEIGIDMKPFKTAEHICSWAGLCPGNNESAGKRKSCRSTGLISL